MAEPNYYGLRSIQQWIRLPQSSQCGRHRRYSHRFRAQTGPQDHKDEPSENGGSQRICCGISKSERLRGMAAVLRGLPRWEGAHIPQSSTVSTTNPYLNNTKKPSSANKIYSSRVTCGSRGYKVDIFLEGFSSEGKSAGGTNSFLGSSRRGIMIRFYLR